MTKSSDAAISGSEGSIDGRIPSQTYKIENLALNEDILRQTAMAHLDFSTVLTNPEQYKYYARLAREQWKEYINWFDQLSDEDRAKLPAGHVRINAATRHLVNSMVNVTNIHNVYSRAISPYLGKWGLASPHRSNFRTRGHALLIGRQSGSG
ncbi:MAG: hypothetical protein LAO23_05310 [Acidobacteriia bacterium]|nr:hypothetical protein [Terriglobia bacterium]